MFLGVVFSTPVRAQVSGATLQGTITDAQGGAVVGAKVSAKNVATGVVTETTTNASGAYTIVNLNPAAYEISITATGFRTTISKITLTVGAQQELSTALTVGEVAQTVEVTGAAPVVETTNATLSGNVEGTAIQQLPLNGRDWVSLATLTPGVVSVRPHEEVTAPGGSTRGLGIQMTINGARPQQNVYRLNGAIVNDYSNAGPGNVLGANAGVDAIQEFSVLTGNYSAEYGDTSGGVINAITKSGTNSLHGSAYEFIRNDHFDAATRFEDPSPQAPNGLQKGHFERNQFGASAGWKVLKDRAFLFGNFEGLRQVKAVPQTGVVLTSDARLGILNNADGSRLPALTGPCPYASQDPNGMTNQAPGRAAVCVDNFIFAEINPCTSNQTTPCPSGVPAGVLAPLPNGALLSPANNDDAFYQSNLGQYSSDNYATVRGDLKISNNDSLTGSWYRDTSTWKRPGVYNEPNLSFSGYQVPHSAYTLEETHIFSPTLVNTFRLGLSLSDLFSPSFSNDNPVAHATTLCVVPPAGGACVNEQIGLFPTWVAGGGSIGGNGNSGNTTTVSGAGGGFTGAPGFSSRTAKIEVFDDISKTVGKHTLKFGVMAVDDHEDWLSGPAGGINGIFGGGGPSFSGLSTSGYGVCGTVDPTNLSKTINPTVNTTATPLPVSCGGGVASYLMDIPKSVRLPIVPPFAPIGSVHHWRSQIYAGYFQDDWKMSNSLTVNLGLRYEMSTVPNVTERNINNVETLSQNLPAVSTAGACLADSTGLAQCPGFYHTTFQNNPTFTNFEPRVGFAWDPFHDGKTSVRGGAGIFDVLPLSYMFALNSLQVAPSSAETDLAYAQQVPNGAGNTCAGATNCLPYMGQTVKKVGGVNTIVVFQPAIPNGWGHFPLSEASDATDPTKVSNSGAAQRWQYVEPNPKRNYVLQYNLNIQRQITPTLTLMVAYAGSKGWHNPLQSDDLNTVVPYTVNGRYVFPNPVGSGCSPGPPNCSQTDQALGFPVTYVTPSQNCVNGTVQASTALGCISANNGITPGLLINSHTAQFQSTIFNAQSWYNALQVKVDKRTSHGLEFGGSFTWGKSFDTSSSSFASDNYSNNPSAIVPWWNNSLVRGLSDFNVTKNVSVHALYQIPTPASFNGLMRGVASGWGVSINFEASDGIPLWPLMVNETVGMLNGGPYDIPDLVAGCNQVLPNSRQGALAYLNPACYQLPQAPSLAFYNGNATVNATNATPVKPTAPGFNPGCDPSVAYPGCLNLLGNDPRNVVIGPGLINLDFSVVKDTHIRRISETANLQFRAEFFNIANHPNYQFPNTKQLTPLDATGATVPNFGTLTTTQSPERNIQFALKFIY